MRLKDYLSQLILHLQNQFKIRILIKKFSSESFSNVEPEQLPVEPEQLPWENHEQKPTLFRLNEEQISVLKPGILFDTNVLIHFEDYSQFLKEGFRFKEKFGTTPIYIISQSKKEFINKKCPKNNREQVLDFNNSGSLRNFEKLINKIPASLQKNICYIEIDNCQQIKNKSNELLKQKWTFGLHEEDSLFLAFAKITNSIIITCDHELLQSCIQSQCPSIEFLNFAEKLFQPSPITQVYRSRRILHKKNPGLKKRYFNKYSYKKKNIR